MSNHWTGGECDFVERTTHHGVILQRWLCGRKQEALWIEDLQNGKGPSYCPACGRIVVPAQSVQDNRGKP